MAKRRSERNSKQAYLHGILPLHSFFRCSFAIEGQQFADPSNGIRDRASTYALVSHVLQSSLKGYVLGA